MEEEECSPHDGLFDFEDPECRKCQEEVRNICAINSMGFRDYGEEKMLAMTELHLTWFKDGYEDEEDLIDV